MTEAFRIPCEKCYGVLYVGPTPWGKHYCKPCGAWTRIPLPLDRNVAVAR